MFDDFRPAEQTATSSYLIVPKATADRDADKLHKDLGVAFKYASSANTVNGGEVPRTLQLELPDHLKQGISDWLSANHDAGAGLEVSAILIRPQTAPGTALQSTSPGEAKTLLSIPPEMRNRIYRFALVEDGEVIIGPSGPLPQEPGLLGTCSQIRNEASDIYYKENMFSFRISNHKADMYIRWCKSSTKRHFAHNNSRIRKSRNWPNLSHWLRAIYDRECKGPIGDPRNVVVYLTSVTVDLRDHDVSWTQAEGVLEYIRGGLSTQNEGWLNDAQ